jgi:DNA-binding XRE family transcriptional regulator
VSAYDGVGDVVRHREQKVWRRVKTNIRFKVARITCGLTQRDLAELVGLPEHRITAIETDRWVPAGDTKSRIAKVLGKATFEVFDR